MMISRLTIKDMITQYHLTDYKTEKMYVFMEQEVQVLSY